MLAPFHSFNHLCQVLAPSIVRDLEVVHCSPPMSEENGVADVSVTSGCGTSVVLFHDALLDNCR